VDGRFERVEILLDRALDGGSSLSRFISSFITSEAIEDVPTLFESLTFSLHNQSREDGQIPGIE
jgi:hypothetical protein